MNQQQTIQAILLALGDNDFITSADLTQWFENNHNLPLLAHHDWQSGWDTFNNTRAIHAAQGAVLRYKKGPGKKARVIFVLNNEESIQAMLQVFPNARRDD